MFSAVSATVGDIFLKIHPSYYTDMRHKHSNFRCNQSPIKGTLIGEQCNSSLLPFGGVS